MQAIEASRLPKQIFDLETKVGLLKSNADRVEATLNKLRNGYFDYDCEDIMGLCRKFSELQAQNHQLRYQLERLEGRIIELEGRIR